MACNNSNFIVNQINLESLDPSSFIISAGVGADSDAFGDTAGSANTVYIKSSLDPNIHYIDYAMSMPAYLVNAPSAVTLNAASYAYEDDPNRSVIANVAAEDLAIYRRNKPVFNAPIDATELMYMRYASPVYASFDESGNQNKSDLFTMIAPKAAHPYFAALPWKSNTSTYGPWTNYPSLDGESSSAHGAEVKVMEDYVPWNYGGMVNLDKVANEEIYSSVQYDQTLEMGSVSVPGLPGFNSGGLFGEYDWSYTPTQRNLTLSGTTYNVLEAITTDPAGDLGPIITNMSVNINSSNVGTTYNFRTYVRKIGFFNKETQDLINKNSKSFLKLYSDMNKSISSIIGKVAKESQAYETSLKSKEKRSVKGSEANLYKSKFFATSPGVVLAGYSTPFLAEKEASSGSLDRGVSALSSYQDAQENYRMKTFVGIYPANELYANMASKYPTTSFMSLDGLFSPVSFYPSPGNATFAMNPYPRHKCPHCGGDGQLGSYSIKQSVSGTASSVTLQCPYCFKKYPNAATDSTTQSSTEGEALPPYVLTNTNDISNISALLSDSGSASNSDNTSKGGKLIPINNITLNPVVVPEGIFSNTNAKSSDKSRHCIEVIANNMNFTGKMQTSTNLNRKKRTKKNPDYADNSNIYGGSVLNNQRFFGFRGPMVLHGWGYDIDGYPVPNASDEPRYDNSGRPLRFAASISVDDANAKYDKLKPGDPFVESNISNFDNGYLIKNPNDESQESKYGGATVKKLKVENDLNGNGSFDNGGDIITQQYTMSNGKWTKGDRSTKFRINFAEQPDRWPVGPIDLRWDYNRKIWTIPNNSPTIYKWVYVTLEEDLLRDGNKDVTYAARGYIDDIEYVAESLEPGYRRLAYVKDRSGFTAPRGAKLLCKYMPNSGFYEPINKPVIVAVGTISGGQVTISQTYARGNSGTTPTITVSYNNPLGFDTSSGGSGIFTFIDGMWTLTGRA
jgi:hypothetical protein